MVFNSLQFVWFFVAVYALYRAFPVAFGASTAHRAQNWLLLVASYYFYAAWDYRFLALLAASTLVDYTCGRLLGRMVDGRRRRQIMWLSIGFNLAMLGFFKYFNFFADNLQALFTAIGWHLDYVTVRVLLPIGISFYTFVTMSYVIDVYRREIPPTRDPLPEPRVQFGHARLLQVLQLLRRQSARNVWRARVAPRLRHSARPAAGGNLVLHVCDDELCDRRVSPRNRTNA